MMQPAAIEIGPLTFSVQVVDGLRGSDDQKLYGDISWMHSIISVDEAAPPSKREIILWHEVLHGILEVSGLDRVLGDQEEAFVKTFAYHLVDVLHRNDVSKWGQDDVEEPD